jgi:hypothetical protein
VPDGSASPGAVWPLPAVGRVLERHDLFAESLDLVNAWGRRASIVDSLLVEGVSYWVRLREDMWHWVHERLLWSYAWADLGLVRPDSFSIPWAEQALVDVAHASGARVEVVMPPPPPVQPPTLRARVVARLPVSLRHTIRRIKPHPETVRMEREQAVANARTALLAERARQLAAGSNARVLVLSQAPVRQVIGLPGQEAEVDPNLESVLVGLVREGIDPIVIGLGISPVDDVVGSSSASRLLPADFVREHWARPGDPERVEAAVGAVLTGLASISESFPLNGLDLGDAFLAELAKRAERIVANDVAELAAIERLLDDLAPDAILLTHEGHRAPWLMAAARAAIPSFAVQHGVLYPRHPGYPDVRDERQLLPTRTFVFGEFEARSLLQMGYRNDEVEVSGSPRLDLDVTADEGGRAHAREALRRHLGVRETDRLLVVSTGWYTFMRRSHLAHMLARLLGGPLPGVHVVFKQHPGERDEGPYRSLLVGLARAGGYDPPAMSAVRDIDLYALLRAADAHLGHQSTVLTEAVLTGTCNLVADIQASPPSIDYLGAGVAWPVRSTDDLREALQVMPRPTDIQRRAFLAEHFRSGQAGPRIASAIAESLAQSS